MFPHKLNLIAQILKLTSLRYLTYLTTRKPERPRTSARFSSFGRGLESSMSLSSRFISVYTHYLFFGLGIFKNGVITENFYWLYRLPDHLNFSERSKKVSICRWVYPSLPKSEKDEKVGLSDLLSVTRGKNTNLRADRSWMKGLDRFIKVNKKYCYLDNKPAPGFALKMAHQKCRAPQYRSINLYQLKTSKTWMVLSIKLWARFNFAILKAI